MIRRARVADVPTFAKIINDCAEYGQMLHRSLSYLYEHVRDYHVAEDDGEVVGICGLSVVWANLAEVYALAVAPSQRGRGVGSRLVEACLDDARAVGIPSVMTLTYERSFFERLGFSVVDRQTLPLKVWSECLRCPKNQSCDEIAMIRRLADVPEIDVPRPERPSVDRYVVPVILQSSALRERAAKASAPPSEDDEGDE